MTGRRLGDLSRRILSLHYVSDSFRAGLREFFEIPDLNASLLDATARGREFSLRAPMKRFGQPEELVGATVFLASDSASYVNTLIIDGGFLAGGMNQ